LKKSTTLDSIGDVLNPNIPILWESNEYIAIHPSLVTVLDKLENNFDVESSKDFTMFIIKI